MKEYIAETGGRYTYTDDILNLQKLALSMTSIFSECSNFIISGCEVSGLDISAGYVWINGKVRYFEGCKNATFPYYLYEKNINDSVTYAKEINKKGRCNYLCVGSKTIPTVPDEITKAAPQFIEMKDGYSPRLIDKFFGKYSVLLETPFTKQTIKKDLVLTGNLNVDKNIESKTGLSIINPDNGYSLKQIVRPNGNGSVGLYMNGLLINEIQINTDGSFCFIKQDKVIAKINSNGVSFTNVSSTSTQIGSILISGNSFINTSDNTDDGAININTSGFENENSRFRNFNVYNGKQATIPLLQVVGRTGETKLNGKLNIRNTGEGIILSNSNHTKTDALLTNSILWTDSANERIGIIGFDSDNSFDFIIKNVIGNITISPKEYLNITGDLKIGGVSISKAFVSSESFTKQLKNKVDTVSGKQLSTEDFTSDHKKKLDDILTSSLSSAGKGFVSAYDVSEALKDKLTLSKCLSDITDKETARFNLGIYSKVDTDNRYLKISSKLLELVSLSVDEINGLTAEQAAELKAQKQAAVRTNIDAEKGGVGKLKLDISKNLSDLKDKEEARKNISVYSTVEIDELLKNKLDSDAAYNGIEFTEDMKKRLENIKGGSFAYVDEDGISHSQVEGFVSTSQVTKELKKKANLLLDGYNDSQKKTIASNIGVYIKTDADNKFASISSSFQDYINHYTNQGKTTAESQRILRDKLDCPSKKDVTDNYVRKDGNLSDLTLKDANAKKSVCRTIGAAYAEEYQTKLKDTGWKQVSGCESLHIRQIGNIVSVQGTIRANNTMASGSMFEIPNEIDAPQFDIQYSKGKWRDKAYDNSYGFLGYISGGSKKFIREANNLDSDYIRISFTYMT